jgi:hypothetical protein
LPTVIGGSLPSSGSAPLTMNQPSAAATVVDAVRHGDTPLSFAILHSHQTNTPVAETNTLIQKAARCGPT